MILNPTHEITLSGLPSEILDAYVRYKKGSRAIVAWLVQYGSSRYEGAKTLPIKELASLAQRVSSKITQVPDIIHFHFKETIAARRCLSRFFRSNVDASSEEVDTVNHEHFTNSLCEIYNDLCERCRAAHAERTARRAAQKSNIVLHVLQNHYGCLPVEEIDTTTEILNDHDVDCDECDETVENVCCQHIGDTIIEDDGMSTAMETIMLLEKAGEIYEATAACWSIAAKKEASFIAAAGVTNIAWRSLRDIELQLSNLNPDKTLKNSHYYSCSSKNCTTASLSMQNPNQQGLVTDLEDSEQSIKHSLDGHELSTVSSCASRIQKPTDYMQFNPQPVVNEKHKFRMAILDNVIRLIHHAGHAPELIFKCTPSFVEISNLIARPKDDNRLLHSTLVVHLLTKSYTAYLEALPIPSNISSCRISALKLARQGERSISAVLANRQAFPCQCPQTLAYHLSNLQYDLQRYAKHKCWDLYFQSPWVAGNHILEMLDMLSYYGMRLFHYRHYVGAILHTYNVLKQLAGLEHIPIFEDLCHTFRDILFPGGSLPISSFRNSWARFVGARLKFKTGHKGHNHKESWCMAVPAHEARAAAGLSSDQSRDRADPKYDIGRIDPLMRLKQQDYHISNLPSARHGGIQEEQGTIPSGSSPFRSPACAPMPSTTSQSSQEITAAAAFTNSILLSNLKSLDSCLPCTSINLLSVFTDCLHLTTQVTLRTHTQSNPSSSPSVSSIQSDLKPESEHQPCICFVTTLLNGADRIINARKVGRIECWSREEKNIIDVIKRVFSEEFKGEILEERWKWDI